MWTRAMGCISLHFPKSPRFSPIFEGQCVSNHVRLDTQLLVLISFRLRFMNIEHWYTTYKIKLNMRMESSSWAKQITERKKRAWKMLAIKYQKLSSFESWANRCVIDTFSSCSIEILTKRNKTMIREHCKRKVNTIQWERWEDWFWKHFA